MSSEKRHVIELTLLSEEFGQPVFLKGVFGDNTKGAILRANANIQESILFPNKIAAEIFIKFLNSIFFTETYKLTPIEYEF